ncbi:ribbon-helix-helix protein, CopG family [Sphingomonas donggukensis]|uniref:Ribbon-helix-helix protein, CopG family n=1 Tax=Sphingomonas donggukensis TaxID=2949093 RepID=A0ABY4TS21_9SPHN|nr:ribbon-helix-helix protein, CopG family [Sphingomonas donggukensis]URW75194.1 ribbon-helix-helix protein, CopG family [Sphingomonas donggukensis]
MSSAVISGRVSADLSTKLDRLAERLDRSRAWIVAKAVEHYVESELELQDSLDEAERQIDRGEVFTQDEMDAWVAGLKRRDTGA